MFLYLILLLLIIITSLLAIFLTFCYFSAYFEEYHFWKSTSISYELKKKWKIFNFTSSHVKVQKRDVIYMSTFLWCGLDFLRLTLWAENVVSYILGLRGKVFHMYQTTFLLIAILSSDNWDIVVSYNFHHNNLR